MSAAPAPLPSLHPGLRKAAVLLVSLGEEAAVGVIRRLGRSAVEQLAQEIRQLAPIVPAEAMAVMDEYHRLTLSLNPLAQGGMECAANLLAQAFGQREAQELLSQVQESEEPAQNLCDLRADPDQLAELLKAEHPQTVAMVLAHVGSPTAADLLARLPEGPRAEAVRRLAGLKQFSPELAARITRVLHGRLEAAGDAGGEAFAGLKTVAEILNRSGKAVSAAVLEGIEQSDPDLALTIRDSMFTFEDLIAVPQSGLREWLGQIDKRTLALAMKGARPDLRSHLMSAMSSRAAEMMLEDMEALGPVRTSEVQKAQQEGVALARRLEADGKMTLRADKNDEFLL